MLLGISSALHMGFSLGSQMLYSSTTHCRRLLSRSLRRHQLCSHGTLLNLAWWVHAQPTLYSQRPLSIPQVGTIFLIMVDIPIPR